MKFKTAIQACLFAVSLLAGSVGSVQADALSVELAGSMMMVNRVDTAKKIIYIGNTSVGYSSSTKVYDREGKRTSVSAIKQGYTIVFDYDQTQRFVYRPVASAIWIKSEIPMID